MGTDQDRATAPTVDEPGARATMPEPERRAVIRKLAGMAAGALIVTVVLQEKAEAY